MRIASAALASLVVLALFAAPSASATILKVPSGFATINAAIAAAGSGDEIDVSKGTYTETVVVNMMNNLTLRAKGKVTIKTPIMFAPTPPPAGQVSLLASSNIQFIGFTVEAASGEDGIVMASCTNCRIEKCHVSGGDTGIAIPTSFEIALVNDTVTGTALNGMDVSGDAAFISGCTLTNVGGDGMDLTLNNADVEGNTVNGCAVGILVLFQTIDVYIVGNTIKNTQDAGIVISDIGTFGQVTDNHVSQAAGGGISSFGQEMAIGDNHVSSCPGTGIDVEGALPTTSNNHVKKCTIGMLVGASADGGIHVGNVLTKNTDSGLEIANGCTDSIFASNVGKQNGTVDLNDQSGGTNDYFDNHFVTSA